MALCTPGTPPGLKLCYCGRQGQATQVATRGEGQPAGGREWARVALKDKELHKPQFLLVLHISLSSIYITLHIFQVHTKCILYGIINYLIWFEDGYSILQLLMRLTSPMSLIEQKINVCHVSAILKHVTVSFRSMKASRPYLQWMQFPQTFYAWIFNVNLLGFFPQKYLSGKSASCFFFFVCVCTCTNLLVLNTEVKRMLCTWTQ